MDSQKIGVLLVNLNNLSTIIINKKSNNNNRYFINLKKFHKIRLKSYIKSIKSIKETFKRLVQQLICTKKK
jgi:hypothetical protein